jgi:photosystem II stability/assembly factor-like uncharacterized protein
MHGPIAEEDSMRGKTAPFVMLLFLGSLAVPGAGTAHSDKPCEPSNTVRCEGQWEVQQSGATDDLRAVFFLNPDIGWAAGAANTILKTTDGGRTWRRLPLERQERGPRFEEVVFVSPTEGWAGERRLLLYTGDGGESWQPASQPRGLHGFGPGQVVGQARLQMNVPTAGSGIYRTDDGGRTWRGLGGELPWNSSEAIFFVGPTGWIAGGQGKLARTTDGGATWTAHDIPDQHDLRHPRLRFVSPERGWLMAQGGHKGGILFTADGGKSWQSQYVRVTPHRTMQDFLFLDEQNGLLLAEDNTNLYKVLHTSSGGKKWRTLGTLKSRCYALSFPDLSHGWVVGTKGFIAHYHVVPVPMRPGK